MSNRPNLIGSKDFFSVGNETLLTTVICAAIDSACSSTDIYPNAYTATLQDERDERQVRTVQADCDLVGGMRVAFGCFLPDTILTHGNIIYSCKGALNVRVEDASAVKIYPIFGQCDASTVTASTSAASNKLSSYKIIPHSVNYTDITAWGHVISLSVDHEVVKIGTTGGTDPLFFGWVIESNASGDLYMSSLRN